MGNFKGWDKASVDRILNGKTITGPIPPAITLSRKNEPKQRRSVLPKQMPRGLAFIIAFLSTQNVDFIPEYKFLEKRKFRFDIYFERNGKKVGVEYDGLQSEKSRHTTITGFSKDCEKLNLAQLNGFIVLRYTTLNYEDFIQHFNLI